MSAHSSPGRPSRRALLIGASGLAGRQVLSTLLDDPAHGQVHAWVRRPLARAHDKLSQQVVDFERLDRVAVPEVDAVFCCLGTTLRAAGSRAAFRRVDHDHVLACARAARAAGAGHFLLVSAIGADARSRVFYSRVKGETEQALRALDFPVLLIARPSLLSGDRDSLGQADRPLERLGLWLTRPVARLLPTRVRPIPATVVARALLRALPASPPGVRVIDSAELHKLGAP